MGCTNSKTVKKKLKERDTLSREGARETAKERQAAAEDELLHQNTSALQATGMQTRDGTDQAPSPTAQDREALEVPVPNHQPAVSRDTVTTAELPTENDVNTTAKPNEPPQKSTRAEEQGRNNAALNAVGGRRASTNSVEVPERGTASTPQSSSSKAENRKRKHRKDDHRHRRRRNHGSESTSGSASQSPSLSHGDGKKRSDKKKSRHSKKDSLPSDARSPATSSQKRAPLTSASSGSSSSSMSIEFQSDATPRVVPAAQIPSVSGSSSVVVSNSPQPAADAASSRGRGADVSSSLHPPSEHKTSPSQIRTNANGAAEHKCSGDVAQYALSLPADAIVDEHRVPSLASQACASSAGTSRIPYEPYSEFGPWEGDDQLPPYEWVPRTMSVRSPLRQGKAAHKMTTIDYGSAALVPDCYDDADAGPALPPDPVTSYRAAAPAEAPSRWTDYAASSVQFNEPTARGEGGERSDGLPLVPRTFYPHLPPVQWPSYATTASALRSPAPSAYHDDDADLYDDTHALYSPADAAIDARDTRFAREARAPAPPSLIDAYVSDDYANSAPPPPPPPPAFTSSYVQPKITVLPSSHAYGPSPMLSAASVVSVDENVEDNGLAGRLNGNYVAHGGVSAHQYKPVTYLFDNSMDNWLQTRRLVAPQRELYAGTEDLW